MLRVGAAPRAKERARGYIPAYGESNRLLVSVPLSLLRGDVASPTVRNTLLRIPSEWGEH